MSLHLLARRTRSGLIAASVLVVAVAGAAVIGSPATATPVTTVTAGEADTTSPVASPEVSQTPSYAGWVNSRPSVIWNWTDPGGAPVPWTDTCPYSTYVRGEGIQTVTSTCTDSAGNIGHASFEVKVDTIAPIAAPTQFPSANAAGKTTGPVTIDWGWSDGGSGIDHRYCPETSEVSGVGVQTVQQICFDFADNYTVRQYQVDLIGPDSDAPTANPSLSPAPNGNGWSHTPVTVAWKWSDGNGSGLDPAACPTTTAVAGEGKRTVTASCTDLAGNTGQSSIFVAIDTVAPTADPTLKDTPNEPTEISWHWSDERSGVNPDGCEHTTYTGTAQGWQTVSASCSDLAGNSHTERLRLFVDTLAPVATPITISSPGSNASYSVEWRWSDGGESTSSGIDTTKCTTFSRTSGQETQTLTATCTDKFGNVGTASRTFTFDTTPPSAAPTQLPGLDPSGWNTSAVTVTWNWTDWDSGVDLDHCVAESTSTGEGIQTLTASCTDKVGNTRTESTIVKIDTTAPAAHPTQAPGANAAGWNNTPVTVTWDWTDTGSGTTTGPGVCPTTSTSTGQGTQILTAICTDVAGNTRTASATAKIDTVAPSLAPTLSPMAGTLVLQGATATASPHATDPGGSGIASSSCGPVDTSTVGAKTLNCSTTDVAGNTTSRTVSYVVGYAVTAPTPPMTFNTGSTLTFQFNLTGANAQPVSPAVGTGLASGCGAKVTLGTLAPVCATYDTSRRVFVASIKTSKSMARGSQPITVTVTSGGTVIASGTTTATAA